MPTRMTQYERQQKRVMFFSAARRELTGTDRYADDWHGAHAEANRIADQQMAALEAKSAEAAGGNSSVATSRDTAPNTLPGNATDPAPEGMTWNADGHGWNAIVAQHNKRRGFQEDDHGPTTDASGWADVIAETNSRLSRT